MLKDEGHRQDLYELSCHSNVWKKAVSVVFKALDNAFFRFCMDHAEDSFATIAAHDARFASTRTFFLDGVPSYQIGKENEEKGDTSVHKHKFQ